MNMYLDAVINYTITNHFFTKSSAGAPWISNFWIFYLHYLLFVLSLGEEVREGNLHYPWSPSIQGNNCQNRTEHAFGLPSCGNFAVAKPVNCILRKYHTNVYTAYWGNSACKIISKEKFRFNKVRIASFIKNARMILFWRVLGNHNGRWWYQFSLCIKCLEAFVFIYSVQLKPIGTILAKPYVEAVRWN